MRTINVPLGVSVLCASVLAPAALAQNLPTSQPKYLNIVREHVKAGRAAEHSRYEAGWPAAYERAKSTQAYLALASLTGSPEVWYLTPYDSHAALEEANKREDADPVLSAEIERLQKGDAEYITGLDVLQLAARPDLSHGAFPDVSKIRVYDITQFHVKPGYEGGFASLAKSYATAAGKAAPKASWRTYEVMAGAPGNTYLVLSSYESFGEFDRAMAEGMSIMTSFPTDDAIAMQKFSVDGYVTPPVTQRYRVDPQQSYVSKAVRDSDPTFWLPKAAAKGQAPAKKP